jgi:basic amino acid/polyamine antiporter, APA family
MYTQTPASPPRELPRKLGLLDSTNIVVGTMIGSAIFLVPNTIAQNIHFVSLTLAMWMVAGILSMFGALAYAELGAMMPDSGGQYVYLGKPGARYGDFFAVGCFFLSRGPAALPLLPRASLLTFPKSYPCPWQPREGWRRP